LFPLLHLTAPIAARAAAAAAVLLQSTIAIAADVRGMANLTHQLLLLLLWLLWLGKRI
jgi:hypothetical protein